MFFQKNHLKIFIDKLVVAYREDHDIDFDVVLVQLQDFRDQLDAIAGKYEGTAPEGGEHLQAEMVEILQHFFHALDNLEDFLDDMDDELLNQAVESAAIGNEKMMKLTDKLETRRNSGAILD